MGRERDFTRPKTPRTNAVMEQLSEKTEFQSSAHRKNGPKKVRELVNRVKPHKGIGNLTPGEKLPEYVYPRKLYTTFRILTFL